MAETPGPVQGQPTPESNTSSQQGSFPPGNEFGASSFREVAGMMNKEESADAGQPVSVDEWTERAKAAEQMRQTLTGGESSGESTEGLLEKPIFDKVSEKYLTPLTPEQRQELATGAREYMKKVLSISDTSELSPDAAKTFNAIWDWLLGKISR